jgi:metal-responsive CopG/Arc/MetJ family transcriptional regulator
MRTEMTRILIPMPGELIEAVEDWRFENRIGSRAEAIRQLLIAALKQPPAKKQAKRT